tara:strand:+ start:1175 stop:1954 length:780 start_codon:yes stop_codon:yes gene_type:complete
MLINEIDLKILKPKINNAALEAIYWWNRTEGYYHSYFYNYDKKIHKTKCESIFINNIFEVFLREYSIRRNFASGKHNPKILLDNLIQLDFFKEIKKSNIQIIDIVSEKLKLVPTKNVEGKIVSLTNNNKTTSLLSKIAFLINPSTYFLNDTLVTDSVNQLTKGVKFEKTEEFDHYLKFYKKVNYIENYFSENNLFEKPFNVLENFKETEAYSYFGSNKKAFKQRIVDKYLWLNKINEERVKNGEVEVDNINLNLLYKSI